MDASPIVIRLLGPVDIRVDGAPLAVDTRKAVALLAYLAVSGRPASRESLGALLWPESDGPAARGALRRTLSVLNGALGGRGLAVDRSAVELRSDEVDVDVRVFRAGVGQARDHGHDPDRPCRACDRWLEAALALDRGPFMEGFGLRDSEAFDEWQVVQAEAHRRELAGALERLARSRLAARSWDRAVDVGRRWVELDPLHEPAHRLLMTAYAAAGEQAAAIHQYRECVRVLDEELGVAPLEATTDLYEAIRVGVLVQATALGPAADAGVAAAGPANGPAEASPTPEGPLVGRAAELDHLLGAVASIAQDGCLLVVDGEPGIGKTRLARALVERLTSGGSVALEARAYAGEATIPYASIAELLRAALDRPDAAARTSSVRPEALAEVARLVPIPGVRAGPAAPDPLGRGRLLEAIGDLLLALVAGDAPGLVWLDDAHWADASTLEAIAFLVHRLRGRPFGVLLTWRREDLPDGAAERLLADAGDRAETITLGRLGRDDVEALARAVRGSDATEAFVDGLFERSEGLPLYVVEALAGPDAVPSDHRGMDALVRSRLASTSELARQVVSAAAVIGRSFDLDTVRAASGRSEEETVAALEELARRGIVREVDPVEATTVRFDFTHGRLRDVAYDTLGLARRRLLHRRIAEALATPGAVAEGGARWSLIAHHEWLAGRATEAAEAHRRAGEHARSVFANAEAREHLDAALSLGHPAPAELHESLGQVLTLLGDYREAIAHLEAAAALAGPERLAAIEHELGRVHARRGDWDRAATHLAAALEAMADDGAALRSAILADVSAVSLRRSGPVAAEAAAGEALAVATMARDPAGIARAEDVLGLLARRRGDLEAARSHLGHALAVAVPESEAGLRIAALNTLALVVSDAGDPEAAIELTHEALALCERQGDRHRQAALENNLADLLHATGRREEAMEHLKRAVAIFADVGGAPDEYEPEIWKLVDW